MISSKQQNVIKLTLKTELSGSVKNGLVWMGTFKKPISACKAFFLEIQQNYICNNKKQKKYKFLHDTTLLWNQCS